MTLRNEAPVFVFGDVMSLQVKDEADSAVPHVVAFARVWRLPDTHDKVALSQHASWTVQEQEARSGPDLCIVATSFSHRVENFYVDLGRLKPWFGSSGDVRKVYQVRETIDSPQLDVTVSWLELQVWRALLNDGARSSVSDPAFAGPLSLFRAQPLRIPRVVHNRASLPGELSQRFRLEENDVECGAAGAGQLAAPRRKKQECAVWLVEPGAKSNFHSPVGGGQLAASFCEVVGRVGVVCGARKVVRNGLRRANLPRRARAHWHEAGTLHAASAAS